MSGSRNILCKGTHHKIKIQDGTSSGLKLYLTQVLENILSLRRPIDPGNHVTSDMTTLNLDTLGPYQTPGTFGHFATTSLWESLAYVPTNLTFWLYYFLTDKLNRNELACEMVWYLLIH